ncbi:hypothetical protein BU17DRAFT_30745, partial [Hysterangium stoloniferum]
PTRSKPNVGRPARAPGATVPGLEIPIPFWIKKAFAAGWNEHLPLTYLTDEHCKKASGSDVLGLPVRASGKEEDLTFSEWHQGWLRLLRLIKDYIPEEATVWTMHFTRIRDTEGIASNWDHWLAYDIEVRRFACHNPLDPAIFHSSIWNEL